MPDSDDYSSASDSESLAAPTLAHTAPAASTSGSTLPPAKKAKGKQPQGKDGAAQDDQAKRRSSKACDNCRKSKCKCTRVLDPATNEPVGPCQNCLTVGSECTFLGASRKRGPPKGYIEAIESRLHRMEALLGGLLGSDDPRAQHLLGELIGDSEARDVLARDLKAAADSSATGKAPKRSWKREFAESQEQAARLKALEEQRQQQQQQQQQLAMPPQQPVISTGFNGTTSGLTVGPDGRFQSGAPTWITDDDLNGLSNLGGLGNLGGGSSANDPLSDALGFDPNVFGSMPTGTGMSPGGGFDLPVLAGAVAGGNGGVSIPLSTSSGAQPDLSISVSPRQRRRLDLPTYSGSPSASSLPAPSQPSNGLVAAGSPNAGFPVSFGPSSASSSSFAPLHTPSGERKQMAYAFTLPPVGVVPARSTAQASQPILSPTAIGHTGSAQYSLGEAAAGAMRDDGSPASSDGTLVRAAGKGKGKDENGAKKEEPMNELADVVGQLSLNENAEVRYHGRSSGLYLIAKSKRFREFFWQFPSAGVWPPAENRILKTEREILQLADAEDPLPDMQTQTHLLSAYWTYVHPHFPLLYKISFMRQYRHSLAHPDSTEPSTPAGTGKVPMVLLLSMFALAARYCDLDEPRKDGKYWTAGQEYLEKARRILNHDYGSSKLVTVQALLLISYREIGVGAMSSAWMNCGMAIRMAQDLGLFRDVEKWYLPVQKFTHEEKQTRKRVWWTCIIMDRYTSSYIGRPGTIHERDYDCGFASEDEPDEHEQWRPTRLDGTEWTTEPKQPSDFPSEEIAKTLKAYPPTRAYTMSTFNAAGALAVIINRIISNIYAIRIRVLGQSSETLLSLLDQSLASWYLALPPHLQFNPNGTKVPPPHILSLHLQFYSSLILLHRPFIPGQNSTASLGNFPSHSICTTSANAIANIITTWRKTFTLRQCPPFLTYPIFSAAIICVYNASFDEALARPAKVHLLECMNALKEMELIWGSAIRAWDLLHGLVDLRDADLNADLSRMQSEDRGTKRPTMEVDEPTPAAFSALPPTSFHHRQASGKGQSRPQAHRRRSSSSAAGRAASASRPAAAAGAGLASPSIPEVPLYPAAMPAPASMPPPPPSTGPGAAPTFAFNAPFSFPPPVGAPTLPSFSSASSVGPAAGQAQTFDILNSGLDLSQFQSPPGTSAGRTDFSDLLNSFLSPTEAAGTAALAQAGLPASAPAVPASTATATSPASAANLFPNTFFDPTAAFAGMPIGVDMDQDWFNYSYNAFASTGSDQGGTPESLGGAGGGVGGAAGAAGSPNPPVL
ncbi:hypothetical protein JCM8097_003755 [Rhodosporidiobolus ruineniae]